MLQFASLHRAWPHLLIALLALAAESPAVGGNGVSVPDPGAGTLLALGLVGLIVGRRGGRRPPPD